MKNKKNEKHLPYFNMLDAMVKNGCPICFLLKKASHKFMESLLYEHINDPNVREKIRNSTGFCNLHSWKLQKFRNGLGMGIIYNDLLQIYHENLQKGLSKKPNFKKLFNSIISSDKEKCPVCIYLNKTEKQYLLSFLEYFNDEDFKTSFRKSFGLCMPHYVKILKLCKDKNIKYELTLIEARRIESLKSELNEFIRKHNYKFSDEGFGKEVDSWIRAIEKLIGKEGLF